MWEGGKEGREVFTGGIALYAKGRGREVVAGMEVQHTMGAWLSHKLVLKPPWHVNLTLLRVLQAGGCAGEQGPSKAGKGAVTSSFEQGGVWQGCGGGGCRLHPHPNVATPVLRPLL